MSELNDLIEHSYDDLRTMYLSRAGDADVDSLFGLVVDLADEDLYRISKALKLGVPAPGCNALWIGLVTIDVIQQMLGALQCDLFAEALSLSGRTDVFKCLVVSGTVSAFAVPPLTAFLRPPQHSPECPRYKKPS